MKIDIKELVGVKFPAVIHTAGVKDVIGVIEEGGAPAVILKYDPECEDVVYIVVHKKNLQDDIEDGLRYIGNIGCEFFFCKELYENQQAMFDAHQQIFQSPTIGTRFTLGDTIVSGSI